MPIDIIKRSGIFIDIVVPKEHAQIFLDRIGKYPGCNLDRNNCYESEDNYHIRVTCRVLGQGAVFSLIQELGHQLGIDSI